MQTQNLIRREPPVDSQIDLSAVLTESLGAKERFAVADIDS
jgi:hypothetical protein